MQIYKPELILSSLIFMWRVSGSLQGALDETETGQR